MSIKTVYPIDHFVASFTWFDGHRVNYIFAIMPRISCIETILTSFRIKYQITIFQVTTIIWIIRIFHLLRDSLSGHWNHLFQISPLLKKRSRKIKISSVLSRIPYIRIPIVTLIYRTWSIWRKERDYIFSCCITLAFVDVFLISPCIPSGLATLRTTSWKRKVYFNSSNCWGRVYLEKFDPNQWYQIISSIVHRCGFQ